MTLGIEWDESLSYADPRNTERMMDAADDTCRFVLERPRLTAPGAEWRHCGGATALLAQLIARGTSRTLLDCARARLFKPLGIEDVAWTLGSDGDAAAASGLRMRPRDLARVGRLVNECARGKSVTAYPRRSLPVQLAQIRVADRLRLALDEATVATIAGSMAELGLQSPVLLRPWRAAEAEGSDAWGREDAGLFAQVAGAHRLEAALRLGSAHKTANSVAKSTTCPKRQPGLGKQDSPSPEPRG